MRWMTAAEDMSVLEELEEAEEAYDEPEEVRQRGSESERKKARCEGTCEALHSMWRAHHNPLIATKHGL